MIDRVKQSADTDVVAKCFNANGPLSRGRQHLIF